MSVNGLYIPTDYSYSNISTTNASIINLTVATFNPVNVDASNVTCDVLNCSTANISIKNTSTVNASTVNASTVNMSNSNVSTGTATQYNINDLILPSNGLYNDASLQTLSDQLRIRAGENNTIGFLTNTDVNMIYDGDLNISSEINASTANVSFLNSDSQLSVINETNKKFTVEHVSDEIRFYGAKNNNLVPSNYLFYTDAGGGGSTVKLKINKNSDIVEVVSLDASNDITTLNMSCDVSNMSTINTSNLNVSNTTINNISTQNISNNVKITTADLECNLIDTLQINSSNINSSNISVDNISVDNVSITDQTNGNHTNIYRNNNTLYFTHTADCDIRLFTNDGTGTPQLSIPRSGDSVEIVTMNATEANATTFNCDGTANISTLNVSSYNVSNINSSNISNTGNISNNGALQTGSLNVSGLYGMVNTADVATYGEHVMSDYYDATGTGLDPSSNIIYPAFIKLSGTWEDYNILNMMSFNNDSVISNRFINIPVDTNISNLNVSTNNTETTNTSTLNCSSLNASSLGFSDLDLLTLNVSTCNASTANISTLNVSNTYGYITDTTTLNASICNASTGQFISSNTSTVNVSDIDCDNNLIVGGVNVITEINSKQDTLTAGDGIDITGSTIKKDFTLTGIGSGRVSTTINFSTSYSTDTTFFPDIWQSQELVDGNYFSYTTPNPTLNVTVEGIKILVAGYYRISYTLNLKNVSFNNRVNVRTRTLKNGSALNKGVSFSYLRDDTFVQIGTCSTSFIETFSVNDYIKLNISLSKNDTSFGDSLDGCELMSNTNLNIEYLGS